MEVGYTEKDLDEEQLLIQERLLGSLFYDGFTCCIGRRSSRSGCSERFVCFEALWVLADENYRVGREDQLYLSWPD